MSDIYNEDPYSIDLLAELSQRCANCAMANDSQSLKSYNTGGISPQYYDAHACGEEVVALQETRTRRSGSLRVP